MGVGVNYAGGKKEGKGQLEEKPARGGDPE